MATTVPSRCSETSLREEKRARRQFLKTTRNRDPDINQNWTPFRAAEKRFKAHYPPPDLSDVLDLALLDDSRADEVSATGWSGSATAVQVNELRLKEWVTGRKAYATQSIPGLVIIPAFLSPSEQRRFVIWALRDHACAPNLTNLDTHYRLPEEGLWKAYAADPDSQELIQPLADGPAAGPSSEHPGPRSLISNDAVSRENIHEVSSVVKPPAAPSSSVPSMTAKALLPKLRWANIGWFYHWGTKQYDFSRGKAPIDDRLRDVCKRAVASVPWNYVYKNDDGMNWSDGEGWSTWEESYEPDAGIVNYYQTTDTLMAHVDRSEVCATSPLVSISLGCAAVFLIGGQTRDEQPVPILLRSGDLLIMSGPTCRRAYHGVPRILEHSLPPWLDEGGHEWDLYARYMRTTRINVNVRQVFPQGYDPRMVTGVADTSLR